MPTDFLTLVQRDHVDLQLELTRLLDPEATVAELRSSLDGVRLGLTSHTEAEDIVLSQFERIPELETPLLHARTSHFAQEGALSGLVSARPGTRAWRERAVRLRDLVRSHAVQDAEHLVPALRLALRESYDRLAGAFATERLRQLSMLQPSVPVSIADFVRLEARA